MIGSRRSAGFWRMHLHGFVAVHLGHHDVHQDDCDVGSRFKGGYRFAPGAGGKHDHAASFKHAAQGKNVADVVVHHQHFLANQRIVGTMQSIEHLLLFRRKVGDDAMQEERGFVEQPLGRLNALHDHAARQGVQAGILFGRQVPCR